MLSVAGPVDAERANREVVPAQRPAVAFALGLAISLAAIVVGASAAPTVRPALYSAAQAGEGAREYAAHCASCHGANLDGPAGPLAGVAFSSLGTKQHVSIGELFRFITAETPVGAGGSLSHREYTVIFAYLLSRNGYPAGPTPLTYDAALRSRLVIASSSDPSK
ncbi:MAG: c-type cytochrome [Vulcanimicrobiaceae bacterium]